MEVFLVLLALMCCGGPVVRGLINAIGLVFWIVVLFALLH